MNTQDFERIKNEVAQKYGYRDAKDAAYKMVILNANISAYDALNNEAAMQFAKECCERQIELCNMAAEWDAPEGAYMDNYINADQIFINEKSILNASIAVDLLSAPVKTDKDDTKTKA